MAKRKKTLKTPAFRSEAGKCTIPGAIPLEAIGNYTVGGETPDAKDIRSYVEHEGKEKVRHLEKVSSESIFGQPMDAWDVQTNKGRWWVITNPTNLYSHALFPSLDYTISFHVGVTTRMAQAAMTEQQLDAHGQVNRLEDRLTRARATLFSAKSVEDFQAVGMKCRECLLLIVDEMSDVSMVPPGQETPQRGNFVQWSEHIVAQFAAGGSNERLRSHLKDISKSAWQVVNWLTHSHSATRYDAEIAIRSTECVVHSLMLAEVKWVLAQKEKDAGAEPGKEQG